ncbi:MAG TPA: hypothetical protein V6D22_15810, partial [Candidatus Obscuribacterales bacterium]
MLAEKRRLFAWAVIVVFGLANVVPRAQAATGGSSAVPSTLNLSSTHANVSAGRILQSGSVGINIAGRQMTVLPTSMLTPAEMLAVSQIVSVGHQSIQLGLHGNAVGGSFVFNPASGVNLSALSVPQNVTGIINFQQATPLTITGGLSDLGSLFALTVNPSINSVSINARDVGVGAGARLSTVLPPGGISGFADARNDLSLVLSASHSLVNNGIISAAGDLTLNSRAIANSGSLNSLLGNVNVDNASLRGILTINNAGGLIQAANGNVNIGAASLGARSMLSIFGGTIQAQNINFNGGAGAVDGLLDDLVGTVNVVGGSAHVGGKSGVLELGNVNVKGDPTFFNQGDIAINGNISFGQDLAILASGNITAGGAFQIVTTDATGLGHNIVMVAGATLIPEGTPPPAGTPIITNTTVGLTGNQTVIVDGANLTAGGNISLNGSTLDTRGALGKAGGNVTLVAYGTNSVGGGIGNMSIFTGGS